MRQREAREGLSATASVKAVRGARLKDIITQNTRGLVGFRNDYVFDVEQTDGAELPGMRQISGTVGENRDRLVSLNMAQGIELVFTEKIAPALGSATAAGLPFSPDSPRPRSFNPCP